jgi:hypothetical protein
MMMRCLPAEKRTRSAIRHGARLLRRCRVYTFALEERTLLAGAVGGVLAGVAIPIALGSSTTGMLAAGDVVFYQVNPTAEVKLKAQVQSGGGALRLALLNAQDQVLFESDGPSAAAPGPLIDVDVPAGPLYLEVENQGAATTYTLSTAVVPSAAPFQSIPISGVDQPVAIASGDFNGDGRTDLAVTNAASNVVSVFLGGGDGTFEPHGTYATGTTPVAIVAGDFAGDGPTDLAVANQGSNDVSVLLGNGDGTFQSQVRYAVGSGPSALVAGNLRGDGRIDLAVANEGSSDVSVLPGKGDGTFQSQVRYAVGTAPDGLATGDFTGDGRTDLAVANSLSDDVSVLLASGGTFAPQVTYAVGSVPRALVSGDFNGDGRDDLAVANAGSNDVSVLLANGAGGFAPQVRYTELLDLFSNSISPLENSAAEPEPYDIVAGDFSGDGTIDLAVTNAGGGNVTVLVGNGAGAFPTQASYAVGTNPSDLVAGDFAGNGRTDLAVANKGSNDVSVLLGNGEGTFQPQMPFSVGAAPAGIASGDFTGNGRTDLAVANTGANNVSVLLSNGDGTFQPPVTYAAGFAPAGIVAGDFTGDGRIDLAVANAGSNDVSVLLGNGDGAFQPQVTYAVGTTPVAIVAGDFRGDGRTDLAVANKGSNNVSVLLAGPEGTFQPQVTYAVGFEPVALIGADFNGDGRTDLATANYGSNNVSVLLSQGDGTFAHQVRYAVGSDPDGIVAGDFNGDGRSDVAVANFESNDVSVLFNGGDGAFGRQVRYAVGYGPVALATGDFSGDGRTDLAVANENSNNVSVLLVGGNGTFQSQVTYAVGSGPDALISGAWSGDGRTGLVVANGVSNDLSVLLGNGDGTFQTQGSAAVGSFPLGLAPGDFNGDGRTDLAVTNAQSSTVTVLLGNGDGTFQTGATYSVGTTPVAIVADDFNGDGRTDLAVVNKSSGNVSILLGNGDGTFQRQVTYAVGEGPAALVAGDFTGDGRIDLAVTNEITSNSDLLSTVSVLLGNGDGTFQRQVTYAVGSFPDAIVAGDFRGDGRTDLAVANDQSNDISVLLGNGDGTFAPQVTYPVGNQPVALATGDWSGDGRMDLAVANQGDNDVSVLLGNGDGTFRPQVTYPVGSQPEALVAGDFSGDGRTDLAVANGGSNAVSLLRGNGDGTFQPQVIYPVGTQPVSLVTGDFNGDGRADLAAANFNSNSVSVLLGLNGTFAPPGALVTAPQSTPLLADLTGDGVDDVLVVDAAGNILWRRGRPQEPGTFDPPVTINRANPSRDIVAVDTTQGPVLASVNATDDAVSLYAWHASSFVPIASLPTGSLPAQIAAADLTGDGLDDLVVRNAGDGTLSIYFSVPTESGPFTIRPAPFLPPVSLAVGPGISDVTLADVSGAGRADIVVTDKLTGTVGVVRNLGPGVFAPPVFYPAGDGLYAVTSAGGPATVTTREATAGVAAGLLTTGGPAGLVAIDPGSNTFSVLGGLGAGRFANPVSLRTASPPIAIAVADLEGTGVPDTILLSAGGVTVYRGDGKGGFLPDPFTIAAGLDPTGMTVADINHDGKPDLLVSNAYGDLLVLVGNGDGTFQPFHESDRNVALAVLPNGSPTPDFIYADQGLDQVVVDYGGGQTSVLANHSSGLLAPDAVALADLNGDGIPDLIVANSGSNNVLVYPGLGNGQFSPSLNGGQGFFTGTNPVGITVANLNGRPDLVIANRGSNDVSILLNVPTADGGFTFVPGERVQAGFGPVGTAVQDVTGDGTPDLVVSDSGTNQVRLIPGVGGGFFNDRATTILPVGTDPGPPIVGHFLPVSDSSIATVNRVSNDVTVISNFTSDAPVFQTFPTGGLDPVAAFGVELTGADLESLVVAHAGDGVISLLGASGDDLVVEATLAPSQTGLPAPSALELAGLHGDALEFYATTEGVEAAALLSFILGAPAPASPPGPETSVSPAPQPLIPGPTPETPGSPVLPLVSTLLMVTLAPEQGVLTVLPPGAQSSVSGLAVAGNESGGAVLTTAPAGSSAGQSLLTQGHPDEAPGDGEVEGPGADVRASAPVPQRILPWTRIFLGVEETLDRIRDEIQAEDQGGDDGDAADESALDSSFDPPGHVTLETLDEAIGALGSRPTMGRFHAPSGPEASAAEPVSEWPLLAWSALLVGHAGARVPKRRARLREIDSLQNNDEVFCLH